MEKKEKKTKTLDLAKGSFLWTLWQFVQVAILLIGGILLISFSGNSNVQDIILKVMGWYLIVAGSLDVLANFLPLIAVRTKDSLTYDAIIGGSLTLALGISLVLQTSQFSVLFDFVALFLGVVMIVIGAILFLYSLSLLFNHYVGTTAIATIGMILGAGVITLGAFSIHWFYQDSAKFEQVILILAGIIMIVMAIAILVEAINCWKRHDFVKNVIKATYTEKDKTEEEAK